MKMKTENEQRIQEEKKKIEEHLERVRKYKETEQYKELGKKDKERLERQVKTLTMMGEIMDIMRG